MNIFMMEYMNNNDEYNIYIYMNICILVIYILDILYTIITED